MMDAPSSRREYPSSLSSFPPPLNREILFLPSEIGSLPQRGEGRGQKEEVPREAEHPGAPPPFWSSFPPQGRRPFMGGFLFSGKSIS